MYRYKTLEHTDIKELHQTFLNAFSDYAVDSKISLEALQYMHQRRGFVSHVSVGAFQEPHNELVGFIFNGLRSWNGRLTAYDTGTGVIPSCRKQGITSQMFNNVLEVFTKNNVEQYLLEVLQDNKAAYELYKKQGFEITRNLSVFELDRNKYCRNSTVYDNEYDIEYASQISSVDWELYKTFMDFSPSWQNSIDSIEAVHERFICAAAHLDSKIVGYGFIDKITGDVPQIAVHNNYRRRGIGTGILSALVTKTTSDLISVVNVDESCEEMKLFLIKSGFQLTCSQYEMVLPLRK